MPETIAEILLQSRELRDDIPFFTKVLGTVSYTHLTLPTTPYV